MTDFDLSKMSEADRASLERMHAASRARRMKSLRASAAGVVLLVIVGGIPPLLLLMVLDRVPIVLLVLGTLPGLALASFVYKKLGPDASGPFG